MRKRNKKKLLFSLGMSICVSLGLLAGNVFAQTEVTLWGHNNPAFIKATKMVIARFESQNPDIKVNYQVFPYADFNQKMTVATATGTGPDMSQCWGEYVPRYIDARAVASTPSWVMTKAEFEKTIYDPSRGAITSEGKYYGMPLEFNVGDNGIVTNWDMFDEAGIPHRAPENWDELIKWAKKLTKYDSKGNVTRCGFAYTSSDQVTFIMTKTMRQLGRDIRAKDGLHFDVDNPIAYKAMGFVADFTRKHKVNSIDICYQGEGTAPHEVFAKGLAAMADSGPWVIGVLQEEVPELDFGYVNDPHFGELPYFYAENGWTMIVLEGSLHKTESWKVIKSFAELENARDWNIITGTVPARRAITTDPVLLEKFLWMKPTLNILPYGKWIGLLGDRDRVFVDGFYMHVMQAIRGEKTMEEASKDLNSFLNGVIDEYR